MMEIFSIWLDRFLCHCLNIKWVEGGGTDIYGSYDFYMQDTLYAYDTHYPAFMLLYKTVLDFDELDFEADDL